MFQDRKRISLTYLDRGDISRSDDDITVNFVYQTNTQNNLVSLPVEQKVFGHAGNPLRHRQMQYNNEGSPVQLDIVGETETSIISMAYDAYGNLATVLMPENAAGQRYARSYIYDPVLNTYPAKATNSFGESCTFEYDYSRGLCTRQTDPNGNSIVTGYDWLGRPVKVSAPLETASGAPYSLKIKYHPARWYGLVRDDHSAAVTLRYDPQHPTDSLESVAICDGWGRPLQTQTDFGAGTSVVAGNCLYDEFGRVTVQYYPFLAYSPSNIYNGGHSTNTATTTAYDVLDRKKSVLRPDGHGQSWVYGFQNHNGMRFVTATTDANGNTTVSYADARGNTLKVEAPENATTLFEYDDLGRTLQTTDPDGFTTAYTYDLRGRLTATAHPDKGTTTLAYDKAGNLTHKATQKLANQGVDIEYVYDYNRLKEVHYPLLPQNNVTYTYGTVSNTGTNACGRLLRVDDGNRAIKMTGSAAIDQMGTLYNTTNLENITIYPNEYLTVTQAEYTKYYYAGGNRIASKIGTGGFEKMTRLCTQDFNLSANANTLFGNALQQTVNITNQPNDEFPVNVCGGYSVAAELLADPLPNFYINSLNLNFTQNNLLQQFRQNLTNSVEPVYYLHSDHLGSASWITSGTGGAVQHLLYLPFGEHFVNEQSTGYNERFTFTGKERDAETDTSWNTAMRKSGKFNTN